MVTQRILGNCPITIVDVWGALHGLELAWNKGFRSIILELDSTSAISLISCSYDLLLPYASVIQRVGDLLQCDWNVKIQNIYREANRIVDALVAKGHLHHIGVVFYCSPPLNIDVFLHEDLVGVAMPRAIL